MSFVLNEMHPLLPGNSCLVDDRVREGVVLMPKGAWMKTSENGQTANALCPDDISEVGGGACFNDARVEVEKA